MVQAPRAAGRDAARPAERPLPRFWAVASYNVHSCIGTDLRCDVARVAQVILELGCDTVGLQEVDNRPGVHEHSMQLEYFEQVTGMQGVAGSTIIRHEGHYGNALLTRRPILDVRRHDLSYRGFEPRGALDVDLDVDGTPVRVVVTHLGLGAAERRRQVRQLVALLRETPRGEPLVLLGDINEWLPWRSTLRGLDGLLGATPVERTFPTWARWPMFALDRIWVRPRGALIALETHRSKLARRASDHFPLRAVISTGGPSAGGAGWRGISRSTSTRSGD